MLRYILKRILLFIPTLLVISLLTFGLSKLAPGDPVERTLQLDPNGMERSQSDLLASADRYRQTAEALGLDHPAFYFTFTSLAYPDTLYRIVQQSQRQMLGGLIARFGNWPQINRYYIQLCRFHSELAIHGKEIAPDSAIVIGRSLRDLFIFGDTARIRASLAAIRQSMADSTVRRALWGGYSGLVSSYGAVESEATPQLLYIPVIYWYGAKNQYHHWLMSFLQGDFGVSYDDSRPVADKLREAIPITLLLNGMSILLIYLLGVPLGVFLATRRGQKRERALTLGLFMLYSLPPFWVATLLIVFFTTPDFGMQWMPPIGLKDLPSDTSFFSWFGANATRLVMPVFCQMYVGLAFLSRQMRGSLLQVIGQDYITTARAKGLPEGKVIWKHAFRNALFPLITLFATIFPAAVAGSFIIEVIFNLNGMGWFAYSAVMTRDWPVVFTVVMLSALLTLVGNLVADILYGVADPRVRY